MTVASVVKDMGREENQEVEAEGRMAVEVGRKKVKRGVNLVGQGAGLAVKGGGQQLGGSGKGLEGPTHSKSRRGNQMICSFAFTPPLTR